VLPVTADPDRPGPYGTRTAEYSLPGIHIDQLTADVEVQALVVALVGAPGRRPLAVFLHGDHYPCYSPAIPSTPGTANA